MAKPLSNDLSQECLESRSKFLDSSTADNLAIIGLGNPGSQYQNNRHNIGFRVVDSLASILECDFTNSPKLQSYIAKIPSKNIIIAKPQTFMNHSGEAIKSIVGFYKITQIFIVADELDIDFGEIRYKYGGSNGGHNGLKSIDVCLGTTDYMRLRFGIGRGAKEDVISYVLGDFNDEQTKQIPALIKQSCNSLLYYLKSADFLQTQNLYTLKKPKLSKSQSQMDIR